MIRLTIVDYVNNPRSNEMNTTTDFFCLHDGKTYHCSEVTTEAYLNCAETCYGHGATLFMLDELEGGQYVKAEDCLEVPPSFLLRLRFWLFENVWVKFSL